MAPYFEVEGNPAQERPLVGRPFPESIRGKQLKPGDKVVLQTSDYPSMNSGTEVKVAIVSDDEAKVLVKTNKLPYKPGQRIDKELEGEPVWFGGEYIPSACDYDSTQDPFEMKKRRQKTFKTERTTIFTSGFKRVEWRPNDFDMDKLNSQPHYPEGFAEEEFRRSLRAPLRELLEPAS